MIQKNLSSQWIFYLFFLNVCFSKRYIDENSESVIAPLFSIPKIDNT